MSYVIADLHGDLLCYLEKDAKRTAYDAAVRCSIPYLRSGHVKLQILAIFTETGPHSWQHGLAQALIYQQLPALYPHDFIHLHALSHPLAHTHPIAIGMAFEGASTFCDEEEPLQHGLNRFNQVIQQIARPLYVSLTWNMENRFGGGAHTHIGLKEDGKRLLEELHRHAIPVDLSHTSDELAYDILNYMDQHRLTMPILASHSNSRQIHSIPRNLPDELAKEIIRRQGLIGCNFYQPFIGATPDLLIRHLEHWLELGGEKALAFGADFFCVEDFPHLQKKAVEELFSVEYANSSCYQAFFHFIRQELNLSEDSLQALAYKNVQTFFTGVLS